MSFTTKEQKEISDKIENDKRQQIQRKSFENVVETKGDISINLGKDVYYYEILN